MSKATLKFSTFALVLVGQILISVTSSIYNNNNNVRAENLIKLINLIGERKLVSAQDALDAYKEYVDLYTIQADLALGYSSLNDINNHQTFEPKTDDERKYLKISELLSQPALKVLVEKVFSKIQQDDDDSIRNIVMTPKLEKRLNKALQMLVR